MGGGDLVCIPVLTRTTSLILINGAAELQKELASSREREH
jgi:hypothetical protein